MAGIPKEQAEKIAGGAKITHCLASDFVRINRNSIKEITEVQQLRLFEIVYPEYVHNAMRFYNSWRKQGSVSWNNLTPELREVFVDMLYQGAMTKSYISYFQENKINNDISVLNKINNRYGQDRYIRRLDALRDKR